MFKPDLTTSVAAARLRNPTQARDRLIVALDVITLEEAKDLVKKLDGLVSFFKIGILLHMATGLDFVKWLVKAEKKVFLDLKYFDVEDTVIRAVKYVANLGVTFLTIHGNGRIIKAAVEGRGTSDLKLLSVTVLTSLDADDIRDLGFRCSIEDLVLFRAKAALEAGCDGVIASGREVKLINKEIGDKILVVTPGIRPEGASTNNHKRHATPTQAIKDGADYLVIGRPITRAKNPRRAAESIVKEMEMAFRERSS